MTVANLFAASTSVEFIRETGANLGGYAHPLALGILRSCRSYKRQRVFGVSDSGPCEGLNERPYANRVEQFLKTANFALTEREQLPI